MRATSTSTAIEAVGYGLALILVAIAAWGAWDLWGQWRSLVEVVPAGWDCSEVEGPPLGTWGDPCAVLVEGRRRASGIACVYGAAALVGIGLAALLATGSLARPRSRVVAWLGVCLVCLTSLVSLWRLTLVDNPVVPLVERETLARVLAREEAMLAAIAGMLVVAAFVLVVKPRPD